MDLEELKEILEKIEGITFTKHFLNDRKVKRNIKEEEIVGIIREGKLLDFEYQGEDEHEVKYALFFEKSNKYLLKIVVVIKENKLRVITSHVQNIKRRRY